MKRVKKTAKIHLKRISFSAVEKRPRRIVEDRGELAILHPMGPVYNPCYFDLHPGSSLFRGSHYHRSKTEVFYVISGLCLVRYVDVATGEDGLIQAQSGDMITIMPMCAHRMEAVKFCQGIEFSLEDVDYEADTTAYKFD